MRNATPRLGPPPKQGLYDPQFEHDACGVGFVVNMKGRKSHEIVQQALQVLMNLDHRGACGCEANTGDGAGILMQMPHEFLAEGLQARRASRCPPPASTASAWSSCRATRPSAASCEEMFEQIVQSEGQTVLGWRTVPTNNVIARRDRQGLRAVHAPGLHRRATRRWPTTWPSSASSTSSASAPTTRSAPRRSPAPSPATSPACPARRSSTRACC